MKKLMLIGCLLLTSCHGTDIIFRQDEILKDSYFNTLQNPYTFEEMLHTYHDGVFDKLYDIHKDSLEVNRIIEHLETNHTSSSYMTSSMSYLDFYSYLYNGRNHLKYYNRDNRLEIMDLMGKKKFIIPEYDLRDELHNPESIRYNNIKLNSYFYDGSEGSHIIPLNDNDMNAWEEMIKEYAESLQKSKKCILVEYYDSQLYVVDNRYNSVRYYDKIQGFYPKVRAFLKERKNITRITFPLFIEK